MHPVDLNGSKVRVLLPDPSLAPAAAGYFQGNREHLADTSPGVPHDFFTEQFWRKRLKDSVEEFENDRSLRLFVTGLHEPTLFIGSINFTQVSRGPFQACYLGYSIAKAHEGQGKMFDGLQTAIRYVFDQRHLHRIMANHLPENTRSARVLARLGFRTDGTSPEYLFINGGWREHVLTSLTNAAWTPRREDRELFP